MKKIGRSRVAVAVVAPLQTHASGGVLMHRWLAFGGRYFCLDDLLDPDPESDRPCLVYSLREKEELSFEAEMHRIG